MPDPKTAPAGDAAGSPQTQPEHLPGTAVFKIIFETSGTVGKGEGPDALDVPEQENDQ